MGEGELAFGDHAGPACTRSRLRAPRLRPAAAPPTTPAVETAGFSPCHPPQTHTTATITLPPSPFPPHLPCPFPRSLPSNIPQSLPPSYAISLSLSPSRAEAAATADDDEDDLDSVDADEDAEYEAFLEELYSPSD